MRARLSSDAGLHDERNERENAAKYDSVQTVRFDIFLAFELYAIFLMLTAVGRFNPVVQ